MHAYLGSRFSFQLIHIPTNRLTHPTWYNKIKFSWFTYKMSKIIFICGLIECYCISIILSQPTLDTRIQFSSISFRFVWFGMVWFRIVCFPCIHIQNIMWFHLLNRTLIMTLLKKYINVCSCLMYFG